MPRVERLNVLLHADELGSLAELCRAHRVAFDRWPTHPPALGWLDLAIARAVEHALRTGRARSHTAALRFVCFDLGLRGDSVRRRWERYRSSATNCRPQHARDGVKW